MRPLTDENGTVIEEFGSDLNGIGERYKFTGKEQDATGLYYFGARYYDSMIGRFITRDPIKGNYMYPQTLNPYVYCLNNPLKYIDPNGQRPLDWEEEDWWGKDYTKDTDEEESGRKKGRSVKEFAEQLAELYGKHLEELFKDYYGGDYDFPIDAFGIELGGAFAEIIGISGSVTFIIDENGDFKIFATEYAGIGGETPSVSARLVFSSLDSEELVNATDTKAVEVEFLLASAQASGDLSGPIPQTLHIGFGYSYPFGAAFVKYDYVKTYVIYD